MSRLLMPLLFALAIPAVHAQATKVVETGERTFYLDAKAIERSGNVRRVPIVVDYATAAPNGMRSRRMTLEADCSGARIRSLSSTDYAEPMGAGGTIASSSEPSDWLYVEARTGTRVPPQTPYRTIWQSVCR